MNILLLSYASEPDAVSEYMVGWMVPTTMAKKYPQHEVYVVTRSRCRGKIEDSLTPTLPYREGDIIDNTKYPNLHFLFYDIPSWMFYKNEMQSHWGEQINYLLWQLLVRRFIKKVQGSKFKVQGDVESSTRLKFDVVHHLTFNQYRTPSPGFWMDVPFVMGPIGGAECIAPAFWQDLEEHTRKKEEIRLKGKDLKIFGWFNRRRKNKKLILCSSAENLKRLSPYKGESEMRLMPAIGFSSQDFDGMGHESRVMGHDEGDEKPFEMIYAGKAWDWKGIHIFLKAVSKAFKNGSRSSRAQEVSTIPEIPKSRNPEFQMRLVGIRFEDEQKRVMGWVNELGLQDNVELIPFIQRSELLKMEANCDLSVYPAFRDSGSMSILEACALGCPSICFNAGGQDIFPDDILLKIPVAETYDECLNAFADKLKWAYDNRTELKQIGLRSWQWVSENLTWDKKVDEFVQIYEKIAK